MSARVLRGYVSLDGGRRAHFRSAGSGPAVVLLHASPLSSRVYEADLEWLAPRVTAVALDTPGYGSSDPLPLEEPAIADYAAALAQTLDALGIGRCVLFGAHTGACIALELAAREPARVGALVLDGLPLFSERERRELLERYCPAVQPRIDGGHLLRIWAMRRDMHLYFPWYERTAQASLPGAVPDAEELHRGMMDHLRAGSGYHRGYAAAFRYEPLAALRALEMPTTLLAADGDGLAEHLARLPADLPHGVRVKRHAPRPLAVAEVLAAQASSAAGAPVAAVPRALARGNGLARGYALTRSGQLHLRAADGGRGRPLLLIHGSPTSAAALEPLAQRLSQSRPVFAFDTLGNGDSDKPDTVRDARFRPPAIGAFADVLAEALDAVGLEEFDVYGTHTGAAIAIELSLRAPGRVSRLILDGVAMFEEATVAEFLERYFVDLAPRSDGSHLLVAWGCAHDSTIWFPWYRRDPEHRFRVAPYEPEALHRYVVEFLKSGDSYRLPYEAAFTYRAADRLPLIGVPTLIGAGARDPLAGFTAAAAAACPGAAAAAVWPESLEATAAAFTEFLDGGSAG